jgi:hypothetical protein
MLIEYRSTGAQTAVPPSIHPSGEQLSWEEFDEAADVDGDALRNSVRHVAAAALIARHWPAEGGRNDAAMALSGTLLRRGMPDAAAEVFLCAVVDAADDDEADDRVKAVAASRRKIDTGSPVTGYPSLSKLIGEDVARQAFVWLTEAGVISAVSEWETPIFFTEHAIPEIPATLLPKPLGDFANALAAGFEVPEALCVVASLGAAATAGSNKVLIELKTNWQEPLNLYLAAALPPRSNKTAVLNRCTRPLVDWETSERMAAESAILTAQSLRRSQQQHIESERRKAAKEKNLATRNTMFANIAQMHER